MISSTLPTAETRSRSPLRNDVLLDATPNFQIAWAEHERELWTALHLWDSQMFYNHEQVAELLEVLEEEESEHRKGFFDAMLFSRPRRMRRTWLGTPVRDIFILETPQDLLRHSELVCRLYRAMCLNFRSDLEAAREWIDDDGNGYLSMDELQEVFGLLEAHQPEEIRMTATDLKRLREMMDTDGDGAVQYDEFDRTFSGLATSGTVSRDTLEPTAVLSPEKRQAERTRAQEAKEQQQRDKQAAIARQKQLEREDRKSVV